jgi:hypothetical protein
MNCIYSKSMLSFLRRGYRKMMPTELTVEFNRRFHKKKTIGAIKSTLKNHGFLSGRKPGWPVGTFFLLTKEQVVFVKRNYRRLSITKLTEKLNAHFGIFKTVQQIDCFVKNHRILSGRTGRFPKAHTPWNTGTKGMGICKGNSGCFKKGNVPANIKPLWSERIDSDGYIWIKVPRRDPHTGFPTRYMLKHVWVWENSKGKTPKGSNIVFKDGNRNNCEIKNLILVTDAELAVMNRHEGFGAAPPELKETIIALSKLKVKTVSLAKREKKL